jgi:DNA-binding protein Fis
MDYYQKVNRLIVTKALQTYWQNLDGQDARPTRNMLFI